MPSSSAAWSPNGRALRPARPAWSHRLRSAPLRLVRRRAHNPMQDNMLPDSLRDQHVCIVGLGYVGLTLAVAMADAGFRVHGVEINSEVLAALAQERAH